MKKSEANPESTIPEIIIEQDIPPKSEKALKTKEKEESLANQEIKKLEALVNAAKETNHLQLKNKAFGLVIGCICVLIVFYGVDVFLINRDMSNSNLLNEIFELVKYILSTLVGYLFATKSNES